MKNQMTDPGYNIRKKLHKLKILAIRINRIRLTTVSTDIERVATNHLLTLRWVLQKILSNRIKNAEKAADFWIDGFENFVEKEEIKLAEEDYMFLKLMYNQRRDKDGRKRR